MITTVKVSLRIAATAVALAAVGIGPWAGYSAMAADAPSIGSVSLVPQGQNGGYFALDLAPGERRDLAVGRVNTSADTVEAQTYVSDAYTIINGGFGARAQEAAVSSTSTWISYPSESLVLDPGAQNLREFSVTVPSGTAPGDYLSSIVLQTRDAGAVDGKSVVVNRVTRQAVAVSIHVPGAYAPALASVGITHELDSLMRSVIGIGVENPGNQNLKPAGSLTIKNAAGTQVTEADIAMGSFYAHDTTSVSVTLGEALNPGGYTLSLTLRDPKTGVSTSMVDAPFTVVPPDVPGPIDAAIGQLPQVVQEAIGPSGAWVFIAVGLLLAALVTWLVLRRRRRSRNVVGSAAVEETTDASEGGPGTDDAREADAR